MTRVQHAFEEQVSEDTPFDRLLHAGMGRLTGGISPTALQLAFSTGQRIWPPIRVARRPWPRRRCAKVCG